MDRGKHPSFNSQRIPTMQLMAKVSQFTGQRKDDLANKMRDFSATTGSAYVSIFMCLKLFCLIICAVFFSVLDQKHSDPTS